MKSARWIVTYIIAASVGLWFALFLSLKLISPVSAQQSPANGELPPEFLQESSSPTSPGKIPPAPTEPPPEMAPPGTATSVPEIPPASPVSPDMIPPMESSPAPLIPQFAADDQYQYDPTGRRDPFQPYKKYRPAPSQIKVDLSDPLQRWDVGRFAIVAIMWEVRNPRAMIKDPDNKIYMIQKSTKIGRNAGQVVAIREGEVVVVESIETEGVVTKEVKILELKK